MGKDKELLGRESHAKGKDFEERVAEIFRQQGYQADVGYEIDGMQFDVRVRRSDGLFENHAVVECKDYTANVTQREVREFGSKVESLNKKREKLGEPACEGFLVARGQFAGNAHEMAATWKVRLKTFRELLFAMVDLEPTVANAIQAYEGMELARLYVEQDVLFERDLKGEAETGPKPLTSSIVEWLREPHRSFLTLLGDFGSGKSSFCRHLACLLARQARTAGNLARSECRIPVLIDLRDGASTQITVESFLSQHFQRLANRPFNPQAALHMLREGYLLLIFDGFDEMVAYSEPSHYLENLEKILRFANGNAKILLTCRTHSLSDRPEEKRVFQKTPELATSASATALYEAIQERPGAEISYLQEFTSEQIEEYLRKAAPEGTSWETLRRQIDSTLGLTDLARRPFLLDLIVKTLPDLQRIRQGRAPHLGDLYEVYTSRWLAYEDRRLVLLNQLTRAQKAEILHYLARLV